MRRSSCIVVKRPGSSRPSPAAGSPRPTIRAVSRPRRHAVSSLSRWARSPPSCARGTGTLSETLVLCGGAPAPRRAGADRSGFRRAVERRTWRSIATTLADDAGVRLRRDRRPARRCHLCLLRRPACQPWWARAGLAPTGGAICALSSRFGSRTGGRRPRSGEVLSGCLRHVGRQHALSSSFRPDSISR